MRRVLHVGPCNTPGGMAKVIEILSQNPPNGWVADTWQSHKVGNQITKFFYHKKMLRNFAKIATSKQKPTLVHIHTAADWSWKRKSKYVELCRKAAIPCVVHIHSGKFGKWLDNKASRNSINFRNTTNFEGCKVVVLTDGWQKNLSRIIGDCLVVNNPIDPKLVYKQENRKQKQLLMLGRYDKVKGHDFALNLLEKLRNEYDSKITLVMTGTDKLNAQGLECHEWVSEEEKSVFLQQSSLLIMPSKFEGQPLVMLEALHCGLPCLVSDKIIDLPSTVLSANYGDIDNWFNQVVNILENPVNKDEIHNSVSHLNIDSINKNWLEIYDSLIE